MHRVFILAHLNAFHSFMTAMFSVIYGWLGAGANFHRINYPLCQSVLCLSCRSDRPILLLGIDILIIALRRLLFVFSLPISDYQQLIMICWLHLISEHPDDGCKKNDYQKFFLCRPLRLLPQEALRAEQPPFPACLVLSICMACRFQTPSLPFIMIGAMHNACISILWETLPHFLLGLADHVSLRAGKTHQCLIFPLLSVEFSCDSSEEICYLTQGYWFDLSYI